MVALFKDQVALVFAEHEPPAVAKVLYEYAKENEALGLVVGYVDNFVINEAEIVRFAQIPSIDVLRAQICRGIQGPIQGVANVLHTSVVKLLCVLQEVGKKK